MGVFHNFLDALGLVETIDETQQACQKSRYIPHHYNISCQSAPLIKYISHDVLLTVGDYIKQTFVHHHSYIKPFLLFANRN